MLTKSVKSVISVVLKHVVQAKKIRAIGAIREHNIRMILPDINNFEHQLITLRPTVSILVARERFYGIGRAEFLLDKQIFLPPYAVKPLSFCGKLA